MDPMNSDTPQPTNDLPTTGFAVLDSGVSPDDRNRAPMLLSERKPSLYALRAEEVLDPTVTAERALEISAHIQTLARDMAGPFPFQADFYNEMKRLAQSALLDDALAFFAAAGARQSALGEATPFSDERHASQAADGYHRVAERVGDDPSTDLWRRAYTYWANNYDQVVRVGRFFAAVPTTWPRLADVTHPELVPSP